MNSRLTWIVFLPIFGVTLEWGAGSSKLSSTMANGRGIPQDTAKEPTVELEEGILTPMTIISVKDTAASQADMVHLFSRDYGELYSCINQNGLRPGRAIARYYSVQPLYIFDVAVEVDKIPLKAGDRIRIDSIKGGNAVIAHFKGPYEQMGMAYAAIQKWLSANDKMANGQPFEVYLNYPANVRDPYELRTDIYQLTTAAGRSAGQLLELQ